ncbi:MAG: hypothetical protein COA75_00510 [Cellvibrionales bacterium]|nr:MAG: hypothetical protein COA75_00510 [Cellvibrionales bacterium]
MFLLLASIIVGSSVYGANEHHHHQMPGMSMDATGMVMGNNKGKLPDDCEEITGEHEINVIAGTSFAEPYASTMFGFNEHEWQVKPCSRITVNFKNEDDVRHQWMLHGLPKYLYDRGMFHMEAAGGHSQTGVFIVPSDDKTYLVHCDIAQHMEKGMKAQLIVGRGAGDLWSIPGVSADFERPYGLFAKSAVFTVAISIFIFILALVTGIKFFRV